MPLFTPSDQYGQFIPDLKIHGKPAPYGVVNEREVRLVAGIMLILGLTAFFRNQYLGDNTLIYYIVPLFWIEFFFKVFISPSWSIIGKLTSWLVSSQTPEYVGAIQKRFAWSIGLIMSSLMFILYFGLGIRGWGPWSICLICLTFMWLESVVGFCAGCWIYQKLLNAKIIPEPQVRPACAGGVCEIPPRK